MKTLLSPLTKITVHCAMKNVANFSRFRPTKIIDMSDLVIVSDSNGYYKLREQTNKQKNRSRQKRKTLSDHL